MKRQQFILNMSLIGAASLLSPKLLFARNSKPIRKVHIPLGAEHIRHGLYSPKQIVSTNLPSWFEVFERDILLSNGHSVGPNDLGVLNLKVNGDSLSIFQKGNDFSILNGRENHDLSPQNSVKTIQTKTGKILILPVGKNKIEHPGAIGICLKGTVKVDSQQLNEFDCLSLTSEQVVDVKQNSIIILIQNTL
ncbi:MAG TPA: hypothetical protein DCX14_09290 [Flavobacteriales bacterium]|nr:hypothetical protein [Flavobacteriales bacterium]